MTHQSDIDAGREPARTMRQFASAIRQDTCTAGAWCWIIEEFERLERIDEIPGAVERIKASLERIEAKLVLAVQAERGES